MFLSGVAHPEGELVSQLSSMTKGEIVGQFESCMVCLMSTESFIVVCG